MTAHSALLETIHTDWDLLHADAEHTYGALGTLSGAAVLELVQRPQSRESRDAVLHALIALSQSGHQAANRVLIRAFAPLAVRQARTTAALSDLEPGDAIATAIGALWETIATYKLERVSSVAGNIRGNMLSLLCSMSKRHRNQTWGEVVLPHEDLTIAAENIDPMPSEPTVTDTYRDLVDVLTWAIENETLTKDEVSLLVRFELTDEDAALEREQLAEQLGVSRAALYQRVSRLRRRVTAAIQEHVRTHGRW